MDRLGIQSLHAGAPDLRLTGDQTQRGTYTQRRRNQMAYGGIAGLDGRKAYGLGSWFQDVKDKFVDDIIPNELKESPVGAALVGGALLNQFGLPDALTQKMGMGSNVGQNWLGNLLGTVTGKEGGYNTVLNPSTWFGGSQTGDLPGYTGIINPHADTPEVMRQQGITDMLNYMRQKDSGGIIQNLANAFGLGQTTGSSTGYDAQGKPIINWRGPLSIGAGIGALDYATRSDDKMPPQLSVNIPQSGREAFDDPNLRFKPKEQYVDTMAMAADGGRIVYNRGRVVNPGGYAGEKAPPLDNRIEGFNQTMLDEYLQGNYPEFEGERVSDYYNRPNFTDVQAVVKIIEMGGSHDDVRKVLGIDITDERIDDFVRWNTEEKAHGGRIGFKHGSKRWPDWIPYGVVDHEWDIDASDMESILRHLKAAKDGGRIGAQAGGLMNLGGMEKDYREEGGFVPIGAKEKADDVPARLSKNEFVFTADAVRNAGGGDIDEGAAVMENLMEHLEAGGKVSEDSQGLEGAQAMFANTQKLQNRII